MCKKRSQKIIEKLDASKDFEKILKELAYTEFPWDYLKSNEYAILRTFAVPSIAKLLFSTKVFTEMTQKRYDDTVLIFHEIYENSLEAERGQRSVKRMNELHAGFKISNEDFLYVLAGLAVNPERWINKNGHRCLTKKECISIYLTIKKLGEHMNIKNIPESYEAMVQFHDSFEDSQFAFCEAGRKLADTMVDFMIRMYLPAFLVKLARPLSYAIMDEKLRKAFNFPKPNIFARVLARTALTFKWMIQKALPSRKEPKLFTALKYKSYPKGYQIECLGTLHKFKKE